MIDVFEITCAMKSVISFEWSKRLLKKELHGHSNALWLHVEPKSVAIILFITLSIFIHLFAIFWLLHFSWHLSLQHRFFTLISSLSIVQFEFRWFLELYLFPFYSNDGCNSNEITSQNVRFFSSCQKIQLPENPRGNCKKWQR